MSEIPQGLLEHVSLSGRYDFWKGDYDLSYPVRNRLDRTVEAFCKRFIAAKPYSHGQIRQFLNVDDFEVLWTFAQRSAAFALVESAPLHITSGLAALAAVDRNWFDFRDVSTAVD